MAQFEYEAPDLDLPSFRLIRLIRASFGDPIICELFEALLYNVDGVDFEALSYAWGDPRKTHQVHVDGGTLGIATNLHHALQHLRLNDEDRIIWVDAICINQDNPTEKGHQVRQMGDIYKEAQRVLIWLGGGTMDTDFFMDVLQNFWEKNAENGEVDQIANSDTIFSLADFRLHRTFASLLHCSWFERVWIVQEVANARSAVIIRGTKSLSTRVFTLCPKILGMNAPPGSTLYSSARAVLDIMPGFTRKTSWGAQQRDLKTLLTKFHDSKATDPRDSVYALVAISSDAPTSPVLKINYSLSYPAVLRNTIAHIYAIPEHLLPSDQEMERLFGDGERRFTFDMIESDLVAFAMRSKQPLLNHLAARCNEDTGMRMLRRLHISPLTLEVFRPNELSQPAQMPQDHTCGGSLELSSWNMAYEAWKAELVTIFAVPASSYKGSLTPSFIFEPRLMAQLKSHARGHSKGLLNAVKGGLEHFQEYERYGDSVPMGIMGMITLDASMSCFSAAIRFLVLEGLNNDGYEEKVARIPEKEEEMDEPDGKNPMGFRISIHLREGEWDLGHILCS